MDWKRFSHYYKYQYGNRWFWNEILIKEPLKMKQIDMIINWVDMKVLCREQKLTENFIRKHADKIQWHLIPIYQTLSLDFIREFADKMNWLAVSVNQHLNERFIEEFKGRIYWTPAFTHQTSLSAEFKRKHL